MNNKVKGWMIGSLLAVSALGVAFGVTPLGIAAAKSTEPVAPSSRMMQNGQMTNMGPDMMKNSPEMEKECQAMMKAADAESTGTAPQTGDTAAGPDRMNSPEMQQQCQSMMKEAEENPDKKALASDTDAPGAVDHNAHH